MAITTLAGYSSSFRQCVRWIKSTARTGQIAFMPSTVCDLGGIPVGGVGIVASATVSGIVPVADDADYPLIQPFSGSGYITKVEYMNSVTSWIRLYDRLFQCGSYASDAGTTTLSSPPSFSGRVPGGTDFAGTELWFECANTWNSAVDITVTYADQDGNAGHTTGAYTTPFTPVAYRLGQIPLALGDVGVSGIETTTFACGYSYANLLNILVLRPLWSGPVTLAAGYDMHDMLKTGLVEVFPTSALFPLISATSTSTGLPKLAIEIASG